MHTWGRTQFSIINKKTPDISNEKRLASTAIWERVSCNIMVLYVLILSFRRLAIALRCCQNLHVNIYVWKVPSTMQRQNVFADDSAFLWFYSLDVPLFFKSFFPFSEFLKEFIFVPTLNVSSWALRQHSMTQQKGTPLFTLSDDDDNDDILLMGPPPIGARGATRAQNERSSSNSSSIGFRSAAGDSFFGRVGASGGSRRHHYNSPSARRRCSNNSGTRAATQCRSGSGSATKERPAGLFCTSC